MGQEAIVFYVNDLGYVLRKPNITEPVIKGDSMNPGKIDDIL